MTAPDRSFQHCAFIGRGNQTGIAFQPAALDLRLQWLPFAKALLHLFLADPQIDRSCVDVDVDQLAFADDGDRSA